MSQLKPKKTPLKFKGQKPSTEPAKRFYHEVKVQDTKDNEEEATVVTAAEVIDNELPSGKPMKKVKPESELVIKINTDKTPAELAFELVQKKRMMDRVEKKMVLTHKERLQKYNKVLNSLPEHYDIHKIGQKIQKGY